MKFKIKVIYFNISKYFIIYNKIYKLFRRGLEPSLFSCSFKI